MSKDRAHNAARSSRGLLFGVFLIAATAVAYRPAWNGEPLWDDDAHLTSPELRSFGGLARIWAEPGATQQYYPLVHTVFWIDNKLWEVTPWPYHVQNILLHAAAALLLWKILRKLEMPGAWLAAGIFALHPLEVESVAWISELKNTLSAVLALGSLLLYLRFDESRSRASYWIALAVFLLGLLCKTAIAPIPIVLAIIFWWQRGQVSSRRDVIPLAPFFMLAVSLGLFTAWVERKYVGAAGEAFDLGFIERCLIAGRAFWFYLSKLFWPANLVFIYPGWQVSGATPWQYFFPIGALLLFGVLFALRKRWRGPLAAMSIFVVLLFPAFGFFNVYPFLFSFVADHFQYLAGIAVITLAAAGATLLGRKLKLPRGVGFAFCLLLLTVLAELTWRQAGNYMGRETFYRAILEKNPACWMAHNNLGQVLDHSGRIDEAIGHYMSALELRPRFAEPHVNLGALYGQLGQTDEALMHLEQALEIDPHNALAHLNLGNTLLELGRNEEAIEHYRTAVGLERRWSQTWRATAEYDLANALFRAERLPEAIEHYRKAANLNPDDPNIHNNLSKALFAEHRVDEATAEYQKTVRLSRIRAPQGQIARPKKP